MVNRWPFSSIYHITYVSKSFRINQINSAWFWFDPVGLLINRKMSNRPLSWISGGNLCVFSFPKLSVTEINMLRATLLSYRVINFKMFRLAIVRWNSSNSNSNGGKCEPTKCCADNKTYVHNTAIPFWFYGSRKILTESALAWKQVDRVFALRRYVFTDLVSTHAHIHYNYSLKNVSSPLILNTFRH